MFWFFFYLLDGLLSFVTAGYFSHATFVVKLSLSLSLSPSFESVIHRNKQNKKLFIRLFWYFKHNENSKRNERKIMLLILFFGNNLDFPRCCSSQSTHWHCTDKRPKINRFLTRYWYLLLRTKFVWRENWENIHTKRRWSLILIRRRQ